MIRVNLLKDYQDSFVSQSTDGGGISYGEISTPSRSSVLLKVFIILLAPFVIEFYESSVIDEKFRKVQNAEKKLNRVNSEVNKMSDAVEIVKRFEGEKKKLDERIAIIKELSRTRLREVIALTKIQEMIPARAWLQEFSVDDGNARIKGVAITTTDVSDFVKKLEEDPLFKEVLFTSTTDSEVKGIKRKSFEVTCRLGDI